MTTQIQKTSTKVLFEREDVKQKFQEILGNKSRGFLVSVLNVVQNNELLKTATPESVLFAAATAATLDLPINQNLGFAYIIPYKTKVGDNYVNVAQFQIGYKGLIQLCQRSGQFKTISATPIYDGQIKKNNPLTGIEFDFDAKTSDKIIGYAAYFSLINGFEKTLYMTIEEVKKHGERYSKTFKNQYGTWQQDFEAMAQKTVLKLLLSKFAPMTVDIQKAVISDQAIINDYDGNDVTYVDNDGVVISQEQSDLMLQIENSDQNEATKQLLMTKVKEGKIKDVTEFLSQKTNGK